MTTWTKRANNIVHRYDRASGMYTLEVIAGEVISDFGIPSFEGAPVSAVKPEEPITKSEMEAIVTGAMLRYRVRDVELRMEPIDAASKRKLQPQIEPTTITKPSDSSSLSVVPKFWYETLNIRGIRDTAVSVFERLFGGLKRGGQ